MNIPELLLSILKFDKTKTNNFFSVVKVSSQQAEIKYGFVDNEISISFFIYGETKLENIPVFEKLKLLFNTDSKIESLEKYLKEIKEPVKINYSPYLKINNKPLIHSFRVTIKHKVS